MAPGTTKAQYHEMLKNFLVERFALAFHSQIGTVQGYELLLSPQGLNRAALNPAAAQANRDGSGRRPAKTDANGFLILDDGSKWQGIGDRDGNNKFTFSHCTMADLADMLSIEYSNKRTPVEDRTGIAGEFDFHLELPSHPLPFNFTDPHGGEAPASDPAPDLASVSRLIEKQLGVVLKPVKVNLSWMIVDHVDKVPRPN